MLILLPGERYNFDSSYTRLLRGRKLHQPSRYGSPLIFWVSSLVHFVAQDTWTLGSLTSMWPKQFRQWNYLYFIIKALKLIMSCKYKMSTIHLQRRLLFPLEKYCHAISLTHSPPTGSPRSIKLPSLSTHCIKPSSCLYLQSQYTHAQRNYSAASSCHSLQLEAKGTCIWILICSSESPTVFT